VDTLGYLLTLYNNGMDGFNFEISGDACIAPAQPSGLPVYFGSERTEMSGAVDLVTGGPC
jgi:hypothetical protein